MRLLLKGSRSYTFATCMAILMHIALGYGLWLLQNEFAQSLITPPSLTTNLVTQKLKPLTPVQTQLLIERPPEPEPEPEPEPKPEPKTTKTTPAAPVQKTTKPSPESKPKKATPKPKKKPADKPRPTNELDSLIKTLNQPAKPKPAPAPPMTPEMRIASRYVARIQKQIETAWIQPPNVQYREMARLKVLIRLTLEKSGRLVSARVLSSSGNAQFDRSALNAVYKAGKFEVPADVDIFNRFFHQLNINYSL